MQDYVSMGSHEIVDLTPNLSTGMVAVSKNFTDGRYVKKDQDINLNNHNVYNLSTPTNNNAATAKNMLMIKIVFLKMARPPPHRS